MRRLESYLQSYYPFDGTIADAVAETEVLQRRLSFRSLAEHYGIENGPLHMSVLGQKSAVEYLRFDPPADFDPAVARVYFAPMSLAADSNMAMRTMRWFGADPSRRTFVFGNPAFIGKKENLPRASVLPKLLKGDFRPLLNGPLQVLENYGVEQATVAGYSFGAEMAAAALSSSLSCRGILMEPPSPGRHNPVKLAKDFKNSEAKLAFYIERSYSSAYHVARKESAVPAWRYLGGLARLTNLAAVGGMVNGAAEKSLRQAIISARPFRIALAYGEKSELTDKDSINRLGSFLTRQAVAVKLIELHNMHHAGGDDLNLHAAIMLQSLKFVEVKAAES